MGKQHHTIIEINGRAYDARTGKVLDISSVSPSTQSESVPESHQSQSQPSRPASPPIPKTGTVLDVRRQAATSQGIHKSADHSKTLMRRVVRKPVKSFKSLKPSGVIDGFAAGPSGILRPSATGRPASKLVALPSQTDVVRFKRATATPQSARISKFSGSYDFTNISPYSAKNAAVNRLVDTTKPIPAPQNIALPNGSDQQRIAQQPVKRPSWQPTQQKSLHLPKNLGRTTTENLLAQGLANADSHTAKPMPKTSTSRLRLGRVTSLVTAGLAILLIGAFIVYQNAPKISVHVAAGRAGFRAIMPGYTPAGFAMIGTPKAAPGQIKLSFKANADSGRHYDISQKSSTWSSDSLLANFITPGNYKYQTINSNGRTVYIYNKTNATWVNGGVWYTITGDASLTESQLLKIIRSL